MNGSGIPVIGRSWIVMPIFSNTWNVIIAIIPVLTYVLNGSFNYSAIFVKWYIRTKKRLNTRKETKNP